MDHKFWVVVALLLSSFGSSAMAAIDCTTVTSLISACASFITNGTPEPSTGSPCCNSVMSLNNLGDSLENRRSVCTCLVNLMATYNPNVTSMANLPGLCGISLGFTMGPNTDCSSIP
ncbi:putative non-specific lipid-transfer protein 14 [Amborella trichopoda]|uniref:putative non-specific lipid-transfer protein 14 n=1 Tax=Amborella trichopoda TaxID=13333 RepID=UPI0009BFB64F|nr:putative non-specific lipid-transfer protein 14 [Amborella trichopoda]|eukprot:XP_020531472.1 putative non-specific lipid-transfer protein 14 [Amborella trichopoda]